MGVWNCSHERSHILDSNFHGSGYASAASREIFCDNCRLQRWLDVEVALAESQAGLGIIPVEAAVAIKEAARIEKLDTAEIQKDIQQTSHSLVPILWALGKVCPKDAAEYIHFGATTQDIQDTAQSLEMREVLDRVAAELKGFTLQLQELAIQHQDSLMVARTHSVPALPTTFGLKVAGWLDELLRQEERLASLRDRVLVVQLFGGVGTMAALGPKALQLLARFAQRLGLGVPRVSWHSARDRVAEFTSVLAMLLGTLARIAEEVRVLNRAELEEVSVGWNQKHISSSTMPHKRNPEANEQIVVLARLARNHVMSALDAMVQEHERDYRGTRLEWCAVAEISHYATKALELSRDIVTGLKVNKEKMAERTMALRDSIGTEKLVFELASRLGKDTAYRMILELSQNSKSKGQSLFEAMCTHPGVMTALGSTEELDRVLDPRKHLGMNQELINRVVSKISAKPRGRQVTEDHLASKVSPLGQLTLQATVNASEPNTKLEKPGSRSATQKHSAQNWERKPIPLHKNRN